MDIPKSSHRTSEYLTALRNLYDNKASFMAPSPSPERSPSDKREESDKVDINFSASNLPVNPEEELIPVIISADNPAMRKALLAPDSSTEVGMPRNVKVDGNLGGGEVVARVDKKTLARLEKSGVQVISNQSQFALPIFPNANPFEEEEPVSEKRADNVVKLNLTNATTKIDEIKTTGKGISIAILDTGVEILPDIKNKVVAFKDFVNGRDEAYDDNGHGTHVAGDAAGTGSLSDGKYKGTAPDANIVGVKVLNSDGGAKVSDIVRGLDWVIENRDKYNIRVVNMSIGVPSAGYKFDPIDKAVERTVNAGIVVVAAAGNEGPKMGTVGGAPGNSPLALTVGAIDDKNTPQKDDDIIAPFSSRGPTMDGLVKPDVVAPGTNIVSLNVKGSQIDKIAKAVKYLKELPDEKLKELPAELYAGLGLDQNILQKSPGEIRKYLDRSLPNINYVNEYYVGMPGTSMAAPLTSGVVADMLEANPQLSPSQVKDILMKTAYDMGQIKTAQGAGSIEPPQAVYLASTTRGDLPESFLAKKSEGMGFLISGSGGKGTTTA